MVTKLLGQPIVARSGDKGTLPEHAGNAKLSVSARRALPSYVSGRSLARGLLGVLVPDQSGTDVMHQITSSVGALPEGGLKHQLTTLLNESRGLRGRREVQSAGTCRPDRPRPAVGHDLAVLGLVLLGWTLMVIALLPGARFWFDALSRLGTLRSSGTKPDST
jgi:hypothetical protein